VLSRVADRFIYLFVKTSRFEDLFRVRHISHNYLQVFSMNKVFKSVWSEALGAWVAASELCRGRGKGGGKVARAVMLAVGLSMAGGVFAAGPGTELSNGVSPPSTTNATDIAIGPGATAQSTAGGKDAIAIGDTAKSTADGAIGIGGSVQNKATNSIIMGNGGGSVGASGSEKQIVNVAVGTQKTDAVNYGQLQAAGLKVDTSGNATNAFVAYDSTTEDKITLGGGTTGTTITNVAAGNVSSATSTDAVNGSQLYATNQSVATNTSAIAANTSDIANNTTDIATNASGIAQNTSDIGTINTQVGTLNTQIADAVKYDDAAHDSIALSDGTAGLVRQDADTQALSIGANTNGSTISFAGLQGARVLTGVANGTISAASSDAVNGSQLFNSSARVAAALGGGASVDANGGVTAPSYTVEGKQVSDVGSAVSNLDGRVTQNSADIAGMKGDLADVSKTAANAVAYDSADHSKVTLGGTDASAAVQLTNVAAGDLSATSTDAVNGSQLGATNARVSATESAIANLQTSGLAGSTATGEDAAAIGTNADASGANSIAAGVNAAASGNDSTAIGSNAMASGDNATAAGSHSTASGDSAVAFGGNAAATGSNAVAIGGNSQASGNSSVSFGGNSSATADNSVALGANSVADEANTVSVGSAGNERRVTNVAPGVNGTDATNVNRLNALRNDVSTSMTSLRRAALGGVAAAMAMPNLMPSSPGKTVVGAGVANYKGYNAFAAGATYRSENGKWLVNGAASVSQSGDAGVRAQAGYEF
jgi:autotransporter adhesin